MALVELDTSEGQNWWPGGAEIGANCQFGERQPPDRRVHIEPHQTNWPA